MPDTSTRVVWQARTVGVAGWIIVIVVILAISRLEMRARRRRAARVADRLHADDDLAEFDTAEAESIPFRLYDQWKSVTLFEGIGRPSSGVAGFLMRGYDPPTLGDEDGTTSGTFTCALIPLSRPMPHTLLERAGLLDRAAVAIGRQDLEAPASVPHSDDFNRLYRIRCNDDPADAIALLDDRFVGWMLGPHGADTSFRLELFDTWALCSTGGAPIRGKPGFDELVSFVDEMAPLRSVLGG